MNRQMSLPRKSVLMPRKIQSLELPPTIQFRLYKGLLSMISEESDHESYEAPAKGLQAPQVSQQTMMFNTMDSIAEESL